MSGISRNWLRPAVFGVVCGVLSGCGHGSGASAPGDPPFVNLRQCGAAPYVGFLSGVTEEGLELQQPGSSPSSDIYGVTPDGVVARITADLGSYHFSVSDDATTIFAIPRRRLLGPAADPAGADATSEIVAINASTGEQSVLLESVGLSDVSASGDGRTLAVITSEVKGVANKLPRIALFSLEARDLSVLPGFDPLADQMDSYPTWSPDGLLLAYIAQTESGGEIRILDPEAGTERTAYESEEALTFLDWAPDGRRLLTTESTYPDAESAMHIALEVDVESGGAQVVFERENPGAQVYSSADASLVTEVAGGGSGVAAQNWQRTGDGKFSLSSRESLGDDAGLVSGGELDLALCALALP